MTRRTLVVFAKAPVLGRVKSRLAAGIGAGAALAFYRRTLAGLLRRVARDPRWRTVLAVTPDRAAYSARLWPMRLPRQEQGRGDLGVRMGRVLERGPAGQVLIVGSDIPDVTAALVWRGFRGLGDADAVFGPARDGGYWLVGARRGTRLRGMFARVRWSSAHALADTLGNLKHRRIALLAELDDIDDAAALRRWRASS